MGIEVGEMGDEVCWKLRCSGCKRDVGWRNNSKSQDVLCEILSAKFAC